MKRMQVIFFFYSFPWMTFPDLRDPTYLKSCRDTAEGPTFILLFYSLFELTNLPLNLPARLVQEAYPPLGRLDISCFRRKLVEFLGLQAGLGE